MDELDNIDNPVAAIKYEINRSLLAMIYNEKDFSKVILVLRDDKLPIILTDFILDQTSLTGYEYRTMTKVSKISEQLPFMMYDHMILFHKELSHEK